MFPSRRIVTMGGDKFRDEHSLAFDGSDDYITMGDTTSYDSLDDLTISAWIKVDSSASGVLPIIAKGQYNVDGAAFHLNYNPDSNSGRVSFSIERDSGQSDGEGGYAYVNSLGSDIDGKWCHVAIVYSNTNDSIVIYINGVSKTISSGSGSWTGSFIAIPNSSSELRIGNDTAGSNDFHGQISDIATYNTPLTVSQIKSIYNGRDPYNHKEGVASGNLAGWWRMGDGSLDRFDDNGLICDNATTPSFGANLVTNGDFADATSTDSSSSALAGWTNAGTHSGAGQRVTISSGQATMVCDGTDIRLQQTILTSGKTYKYSIDIISNDGAEGTAIRLETGAGTEIKTLSTGGTTYTGYFVADNTVIRIRRTGACNVTFDNVIIQEVSGNSGVMINMAADDFTGETP